ncbi:MAG: histidine phosphatase family protein [Lachnospiraceae bacterium]|nr:histidine phosphatase family protein [Lachnospiraceae bacterium]
MWNRAENQIMLAFIRHGVTQANKERRYLGKTDETLSESGIEILRSYKAQNYYPDAKYLFVSPMKRCMETAKILYPKLCPVKISEWEEIDFGRFEYKNYNDLKDDMQYQAWIDSGGRLDFPEGESKKDFILRCESGFIRMCNELRFSQAVKQNTNCYITVGIIVHGGTIMALLSSYGEKNFYDYQVSNGGGCVCRMTGFGSNVQLRDVIKI